ncbi:hypothetical protein QAD02_013912 [Eretmocerus hayati]|uniref:Uncharacterized protein n=1 Tax=Eretmocerus hayati TaxID=131215 RepID=A0ACC2P420_9HYME|nr:hypothetical protein QAD02_013912 [Eretmocerus hayati]
MKRKFEDDATTIQMNEKKSKSMEELATESDNSDKWSVDDGFEDYKEETSTYNTEPYVDDNGYTPNCGFSVPEAWLYTILVWGLVDVPGWVLQLLSPFISYVRPL